MPPSVRGRPYLERLSTVEGITVWVVNGAYVRGHWDIEFTNFGHHLSFPFIPAGEFWLDRQSVPGEEDFFILHMKLEHRLMAQGMDYDRALERAGEVEQYERDRSALAAAGRALMNAGRREELLRRLHKEAWAWYPDGLEVWVVDGELVRDLFFIDFTEGGHDKVYAFIPEKEIWIDDDLVGEERPFVLVHELTERRLMSGGMDYDSAHRASSRVERRCRRHPERLGSELRRAIGLPGASEKPGRTGPA